MTAARVLLAGAALAVVVVYAGLALRWTSAGSDWYRSLPRPRWQPPDLVFGVIWPLNFGALAVVGLVVTLEWPPRDALPWLGVLVASVALSLGWAHTFYRRHALGPATGLLAGAAVLTWLLVSITAGLVTWAGWALVPYASWLTVATSLAVGYWRPAGRGTASDPARGFRAGVHPRAAPARK